ncbi:MAG: hypothetical protein GY780_00555 [bacterium]|nr:hypothetical protein [bacterium]
MGKSNHLIQLYLLALLMLVLVSSSGCDRRDNDWDSFNPNLKQISVVIDTLQVSEEGQSQTFEVSLGMVPADTVWVYAFETNSQVILDPDTLIFVPVDDSWAAPQAVTVQAIDDAISEGLHEDIVTVVSYSRDSEYGNQSGEGPVVVAIADNDSVAVLISETSLTLVESEAGVVRETYRIRLNSEPVANVTVNVAETPEEASLHIEPSTVIFDSTNWNVWQDVVLWIELDEIDNDDLTLTLEHSATSLDENYDATLEIPSLIVTTFDFTLPPIARLHFLAGSVLYENDILAQVPVQISLDRPSMDPVVVHLFSVDGTATGNADFVTVDQTVTFVPGDPLLQQLSVSVIDDVEIEPMESFELFIEPVDHVIIGEDDRLAIDVVDNDLTPLTLSVTNASEDSGSAEFIVSIPFAETVPISFTFSTSDGTALAGEDYETHNQTYVLEAGVTQRSISVVLEADAYHEPDETFSASLSAISNNAGWADAPTVCTILNDDPQTVTMNDIQFNEDAGNATFTLELLAPYNMDVNLQATTHNGDGIIPAAGQLDALGGSDFTSFTDEPWVIPAGSTSATFDVPINDETDAESLQEYFRLEITSSDQPLFLGTLATCTLVDNDQPCLMVSDVFGIESDPDITFTVKLLDENLDPITSSADISFLVETADQTAEATIDYSPVSQTVTIAAGQDSIDIPVVLLDDIHDDDNETFVLTLSEMINAEGSCGTDDAFCTLADDEFPSLNLQSAIVRLNEGSVWEFTVLLTTPRQDSTTYDLDLLAGTSQGEGLDYSFADIGTHTINAMETEVTFTVPFLDDQLADEDDEVIWANISNANVALGVVDLESTIVDAPELSIGSAAGDEGETVLFDVFLDAPSTADIQFNLQFANDTATMGADFDNTATGPYTFLAGETATTVPVELYSGDGGDAATEVFVITIVSATNATVSANNSGLGTITDMDPPELSWAADAIGLEGEDVEFTVNLSWSSEVEVEFNVNYFDGTAARAGIDYDDSFAGPFVVPAGATTFMVSVPAVADGGPELTYEDFTIMLHTPVNAVLGMPISATGYVQDADQPELTIPLGATAFEGNSLVFTVHLSEQTIVPVFFQLEYDIGSTQGIADFFPPGTSVLSMMPGTVDTTITIITVEDAVHENQEAFILRLAADPVNCVLGSPFENVGVINDDDP